jgi:phytoene synthase
MSIDACAGIVLRGDPDRYAAVMAMPVPLRAGLFVLFAFNLEVARAPWASKEALICEMRLQWWRDIVAEPTPRAHEVAAPLHALIKQHNLPLDVIDRLIAARSWDIYTDPFDDAAAFDKYLDDTMGGLLWLCALVGGAAPQAERHVRQFAWGVGLASYLGATAQLEASGKRPLIDGRPDAVRDLARRGLQSLSQSRKHRAEIGAAGLVLLVGWQATGLLQQVASNPMVVKQDQMQLSEFRKRGGLAWAALTGRW